MTHDRAQRDGSQFAGGAAQTKAAQRSVPLPVIGSSGDRRRMAMAGRRTDGSADLDAGLRAHLGTGTGLLLRRDDWQSKRPREPVDCSARMPICQAVCCKLDFALTREEVLAGRVQWDLARPFFVGRAANGYCVHNDRRTGGCGVYADRPAVCRHWSCAHDPRIWSNFEQMELNGEWLSAKGFIGEGWAFTSSTPEGSLTPHTEQHTEE